MRGVQIFSGSSHPILAEAICERLGTSPAKAELRKFSNGETSVNIGVSVRNQDVYIVQSGSSKINDTLMELLIMISACKGGSAKTITAVMPYFPYSRQSKKKSHRGAITARMIANLLTIAGVDHVITLDLHASQMQGFFGKPVDNLFGEPLIARWIRMNVYGWREAVVVSKNAGGSKRVTSLADALKLNFGIVTTDRRRPKHGITLTDSTIFFDSIERDHVDSGISKEGTKDQHHQSMANEFSVDTRDYFFNPPSNDRLSERRLDSPPSGPQLSVADDENDYTDERARDVITARIVQGRIVDDDYSGSDQEVTLASTPRNSNTDKDNGNDPLDYTFDPMAASIVSMNSSLHPDHALGGTYDAAESDDDVTHASENNEQEQTITLVGDVKGKIVFIIDDMIDKSGSWIAAAETVVKKGGAKKVYCIATHGLFGGDSLDAMEACEAIDSIVITNSFPVSPEKASRSRKLQIIDVATLLSESIRRHHYGESISALFQLPD